jgi:uncharacterized protein YdhG (YjbR/CyaY superfamily)
MMTSTGVKFKNIDQYIATFPKEIQELLEILRETIKDAVPGAEEAISYQIPTFTLNGKIVLHFAAFKKHIGFYPTPSGIETFRTELSSYEVAKGSVKFPIDKPLPLELIIQIANFRVNELMDTEK